MNIFQQLFKSMYSPKDISRFRFQGIGKTILFLFFLALVSIIPASYYLISFTNNAIEGVTESLKEDLPSFTIQNGELSSDNKEPIEIERDQYTFLFDSTGTVTEGDLDNNENMIALLKDKFVIVNAGSVQSSPYSMVSGLNVTNEDILDFVKSAESLKYIFIPVMIIVLYLTTSASLFLKVTIFALIGLLLANMLNRKLPYRQSWRITAYSVTLSTIFLMLMGLFQIGIPGSFLLDWFVICIMLYLSIKEIPKRKTA
jgi:maltodextrin utilization protein YvdJ